MRLLERIIKFSRKKITTLIINKVIFKTIKDSLTSNKGYGVPASIFFDESRHLILGGFIDSQISAKYGVFVDTVTQEYYVTRYDIVVWQDVFQYQETTIQTIRQYFLDNKELVKAFELAALGHWEESRECVDTSWNTISKQILSCRAAIFL